MEMLNVALVGAGRMGQLRAPILYANPRVALVCVVESDAVRGEALATRFHTRHYTTLSDAKLHLPHINSIVLCTPTFTHSLAIKEAATLGLHIFTEKPISEDSTEIQQSYRVCQEHKVTLCCGFQRRFDKSYINMRNAIKSGKIGDPKMIHVFFADHPPPPLEFLKHSGDPFMDLSPHDVDFVRWILDGAAPVEVFGTGSSSNSELAACGVLDNATMYIKFEGGVTCNIMMSRGSTYGYDQRCEVYGDGGIASIRSGNESSLSVGNNDGFHQSPLHFSFPQCFREAFEAEIETFASVLLDGVEWPVSEKDCVLAQLIAQAAKESCRLGCAVVMQPIYTPNAISLRPIGKGSFAQHMLGLLSDLDSKKLMFTVLPPYSPSSGLDYDSDVLKHTSVEAVYICSPDSMHHSQAVDCLRAGKHVLVEKPVYDFSGLMCAYKDMYQHASGAGIGGPRAPVFMVGFHRRFDQEFIRAKHACRVTIPTSLVVESRDPVPADSDLSFVIRNSVCHDVDLVHWLFAEYCECTVSFTKCSTDVSISGINLEGEIIIVLDDGDECKIDLKILYSKENKTYVQKCVLDGVIYGYDFAPAVEASNPYLIYQSAYEAQWKYFAGLIRDDNNMKTEEDNRSRWESYNNSFNSLEQAELLMSQSLGA